MGVAAYLFHQVFENSNIVARMRLVKLNVGMVEWVFAD